MRSSEHREKWVTPIVMGIVVGCSSAPERISPELRLTDREIEKKEEQIARTPLAVAIAHLSAADLSRSGITGDAEKARADAGAVLPVLWNLYATVDDASSLREKPVFRLDYVTKGANIFAQTSGVPDYTAPHMNADFARALGDISTDLAISATSVKNEKEANCVFHYRLPRAAINPKTGRKIFEGFGSQPIESSDTRRASVYIPIIPLSDIRSKLGGDEYVELSPDLKMFIRSYISRRIAEHEFRHALGVEHVRPGGKDVMVPRNVVRVLRHQKGSPLTPGAEVHREANGEEFSVSDTMGDISASKTNTLAKTLSALNYETQNHLFFYTTKNRAPLS